MREILPRICHLEIRINILKRVLKLEYIKGKYVPQSIKNLSSACGSTAAYRRRTVLVWYLLVWYLFPCNMFWVGFFIWYTEFQCLSPSPIQEFSWCVIPCNIFCQPQEVRTVNCTFPFFTSELIPFQTLGNLVPLNFLIEAERTTPLPPTLKLSSMCSADSIDSSYKTLRYLHPIALTWMIASAISHRPQIIVTYN